MSNIILVSCIQYKAFDDEEKTLKKLLPMIVNASKNKPNLIALPECATFLCNNKKKTLSYSTIEEHSLTLKEISKLAKSFGLNILIGSLQTIIRDNNKKKLVNRSFLIDVNGKILSRYDKIHMFDVKLPNGKTYNESKTYTNGKKAVISNLIVGNKIYKLGLTICYDVRFPVLFRDLAKAGAEIITVPSAFTKKTGESHWHTLLKARAIETGCYILAPAQTGKHFQGRESYGHSLIVSPWGKILADGGKNECIINAKIDISKVSKTRYMIPNLSNEKHFTLNI